MTDTDKPEFKAGDKVTTKDGRKLVVVSQNTKGGAVHAKSADEKAKPFVDSYFAADSLKAGS